MSDKLATVSDATQALGVTSNLASNKCITVSELGFLTNGLSKQLGSEANDIFITNVTTNQPRSLFFVSNTTTEYCSFNLNSYNSNVDFTVEANAGSIIEFVPSSSLNFTKTYGNATNYYYRVVDLDMMYGTGNGYTMTFGPQSFDYHSTITLTYSNETRFCIVFVYVY